MLRSSWRRDEPRGFAVALAEHPLENLARIDLHRHRRRRRAPRQRVHVDTAVVAIAGADQPGVVFRGELHRRQQRVLADDAGCDLIGRDTGVRIDALRWLRPNAREPRRGGKRVHRSRIGGAVVQAAHDAQPVAVRLERAIDVLEREALPGRVRGEAAHDHAVRHVDETETRGLGRSRGERRRHRVEQRQRHGRTQTLQEGAARKLFLADEHAGFLCPRISHLST